MTTDAPLSERVLKLLLRLDSPNDHEVLQAARALVRASSKESAALGPRVIGAPDPPTLRERPSEWPRPVVPLHPGGLPGLANPRGSRSSPGPPSGNDQNLWHEAANLARTQCD
jgi:hypothetical protein